MNELTAYRTFGNPGYSPAKRVRLYNDRWYLVTFQNVDRDPSTDYIGLGSGTYTELLPGREAREARDAYLNHCNAIQEYSGPVYQVFLSEFGYEERSQGYFPSESQAQQKVDQLHLEAVEHQHKCLAEAVRHEGYDAAKVVSVALKTGAGIARIGDPGWVQGEIAWHQKIATECREAAQRYAYSVRVEKK